MLIFNPLIQQKAKTRENFPHENPLKCYPTFTHCFIFQANQLLNFKIIFSNHGTMIFQNEGHGQNDPHIPIRGRQVTDGHEADIPLEI